MKKVEKVGKVKKKNFIMFGEEIASILARVKLHGS